MYASRAEPRKRDRVCRHATNYSGPADIWKETGKRSNRQVDRAPKPRRSGCRYPRGRGRFPSPQTPQPTVSGSVAEKGPAGSRFPPRRAHPKHKLPWGRRTQGRKTERYHIVSCWRTELPNQGAPNAASHAGGNVFRVSPPLPTRQPTVSGSLAPGLGLGSQLENDPARPICAPGLVLGGVAGGVSRSACLLGETQELKRTESAWRTKRNAANILSQNRLLCLELLL